MYVHINLMRGHKFCIYVCMYVCAYVCLISSSFTVPWLQDLETVKTRRLTVSLNLPQTSLANPPTATAVSRFLVSSVH